MLGQTSGQAYAGGVQDRWYSEFTERVSSRVLVSAGLAMFGLYIAADVIASVAYDGYSYRDQTISELSAVDAPTRGGWLVQSVFYEILAFAFAFGVLRMAGERRAVRGVGWMLLAFAVVGPLWWFAPMHQREVLAADGGDWKDTMHLVLGGLNSVVFFAMIGAGAFAFGRRFRWYSFATLAVILVFGALMGLRTGAVGENEATPWLGIYERIAIEGSMLWMAVFAGVLLWEVRSRSRG